MMRRSPPMASLRAALAGLVVTALSASAAHAAPEPLEAPDESFSVSTPARFVMGFKAGAGGALWDEPDGTTLFTFQGGARAGERFDVPIFDETRGGYTISSGFFMEGIFYDYFGLEIGAYFTQHTLLEKIDWSFVETVTINGVSNSTTFEAESEQELSWTSLHIPILVKAVVPSGQTRISLGVGPEFSLGSWSRSSFKITDGGIPAGDADCGGIDTSGESFERLPGSRCALTSVRSKLENSIYLAVVFGIEIVVGDFLIPIDIHWAYNFSQATDYLDRAAIDPDEIPNDADQGKHPTAVTLTTRDTMYGGIRIGIAYQFD